MMNAPWRRRRRRLIFGVVGVVVLVVLVAFLAPYIYIHFIEGPAPAKLALPNSSGSTTSSTSKGSASRLRRQTAAGTSARVPWRVTGCRRFWSARTRRRWVARARSGAPWRLPVRR